MAIIFSTVAGSIIVAGVTAFLCWTAVTGLDALQSLGEFDIH